MSQERLGRLTRMSQAMVSRIESGSVRAPLDTLELMARAVGLRLEIQLHEADRPDRTGGWAGAFSMFEAGLQLQRDHLRGQGLSEEEVDARLRRWLAFEVPPEGVRQRLFHE